MRPVRISPIAGAAAAHPATLPGPAGVTGQAWRRGRARPMGWTILLVLACAWPAWPAEFLGEPPKIGFQVVVHRAEGGDEITPLHLRRIFLRQITHWPDGQPIVPVNGPPDSELRRAITRWLFPEGRAGLVYHWNKLYYQGVLPPRALASYPAVALMVARVPGAIGYLPAGQPHPNLRVLRVAGVPSALPPAASRDAP